MSADLPVRELVDAVRHADVKRAGQPNDREAA